MKKNNRSILTKFLKYFGLMMLIGLIAVSTLVLSVSLGFFGPVPSKKELANLENKFASKLVDRHGKDLGYIYDYFRFPVESNEISEPVKQALVSTEDERFYEHSGIDYKALGRVFVKTILLQDRSAGGGSTIHMQLVKNLYPRNISNSFDIIIAKIREALIALKLDEIYSKEEILTLYLNTVSFSDNTFGIEAAANTFFGVTAKDLNEIQAATLIGSLKATYTYNPRIFPERSKQRRNIVLLQMYKNNHLRKERFEDLKKEILALQYTSPQLEKGNAAYFREKVRQELEDWIKENKDPRDIDLYSDGLIIETTLDKKLQLAAEEASTRHLHSIQNQFEKEWGKQAPWKKESIWLPLLQKTDDYKALQAEGKTSSQIIKILSNNTNDEKRTSTIDSIQSRLKQLQIGFVALDATSREVLAYIGGSDFSQFKYDHVVNSKRQIGSTIKPFLYAAALENGVKPCDYFGIRAVRYSNLDGWQPSNASNKEEDNRFINVNMKEALRRSINTASVKILEEVGIANLVAFMEKMGLKSKLPMVPALALGAAELSVMELAKMYTTLLSNTPSMKPRLIRKIYNARGEVLEDFTRDDHGNDFEEVYEKINQKLILNMMEEVVLSGTARRLNSTYKINRPIAGKTGTTQNNHDAWFVGLTPDIVSVTWVGNDHGAINFRSTGIGQGANAALPHFAKWYQQLPASYAKGSFIALSEREKRRFDCPPVKEDGFFKKIFSNKDEVQEKDFEKEKKKGFFKRIFGN